MPTHEPVMTAEMVAVLDPSRGGLFVDCTVGGGGHARALLEAGAERLLGLDRDGEALPAAADKLRPWADRVDLAHADFRHLVFTGVTRDGTWLVERGRITRPIKNMRYVDSHLFFLNNLEGLGEPVLTSGGAFVLPPVRSRDFNFTALADVV